MNLVDHSTFDNVIFRIRENSCLVSSVVPPFRTAYWSDLSSLSSEIGLAKDVIANMANAEAQERLLVSLGGHASELRDFLPTKIGFKAEAGDLRRREQFRANRRTVVFIGVPPRDVALGVLEHLTNPLGRNGAVEVVFKESDLLRDWPVGRELVCDVTHLLYTGKRFRGNILLFSSLQDMNSGLWEFLYDHPRGRVGWVASELARCCDKADLDEYRRQSPSLRNLQAIGELGIWPHIILPVSGFNVDFLPELVLALIEASRGGTIEVLPQSFLSQASSSEREFAHSESVFGKCLWSATDPRSQRAEGGIDECCDRGPIAVRLEYGIFQAHSEGGGSRGNETLIQKYVEALLAIYREPRIPIRLVSPLSWVAARIDTETSLISSPSAIGAEVAVLPNGDLYAGEAAIGLESWYLGNVADDFQNIRWERLDAVPEVFSNCMKPDECQRCDWRYRCGGLVPSVYLLSEASGQNLRTCLENAFGARPVPGRSVRKAELTSAATGDRSRSDQSAAFSKPSLKSLFQLYCAPRKALLEEALWDSADSAAAGKTKEPRERLELHADGLDFKPASIPEEELCP